MNMIVYIKAIYIVRIKSSKNLELAIQEFIKGTEKDIKKRNFDKRIATTCAEKV